MHSITFTIKFIANHKNFQAFIEKELEQDSNLSIHIEINLQAKVRLDQNFDITPTQAWY